MPHRIEVFSKVKDPRCDEVNRHLPSGTRAKCIAVVDCYTIDKKLSAGEVKIAATALINPVYQGVFEAKNSHVDFDWSMEIGFLPGVTDNVAHTVRETVEDLLKLEFKNGESVYSSRLFLFQGKIGATAQKIIAGEFHNPLIENAEIKTRAELVAGSEVHVPKVVLKGGDEVTEVNLDLSDEKLLEISEKGILGRGPLGLSLDYMKAIRDYFKKQGRNPTDIELETLAQTWSEHCKHTIFASEIDEVKDGLYRHYIKRATSEIRKRKGNNDICVSVFTDNSGAIVFDENWLITDKVETHNSPSALDPFGGAITGVVGVNRDCLGFGKGAKPIANRYAFCLAPPESDIQLYRGKDKTNPMLKPRQIMEGVVHGINVGGNCSGIPTPAGTVYFDERFSGKPLVFAGTVGIIPRTINGKPSHEKKAQAGDKIVVIGGRVGKDGIHGATFSSVALYEGSPATAVQIGDPITQKKFSDAIVREAREKGLYNAITDNGAGGLSSSVGEMAEGSGGFVVELERVPLKYPGLEPWEIWISESQERMTLAVPEAKIQELFMLLAKRGVEATIIGEFTSSGFAEVKHRGRTIMKIEMEFLHDGLPPKVLTTSKPQWPVTSGQLPVKENSATCYLPLATKVAQLLSSLNICSKEFIATQYDHEVQAASVLKPVQGKGRVYADSAVIRPVLSSKKGVVMSQALCPAYSEIDAYNMAASAIDAAVRSAVAAGANLDHLALLDNFCWCSSNDAERLYQLKEAARACFDYATAYGTPFISGKDSMFNDFSGYDENGKPIKVSIPPTLLVSTVGVMDDATKAVSLDFKFAGDIIYVLGETKDEMGGSEWQRVSGFGFQDSGKVPAVDSKKAIQLYEAFAKATSERLVSSAISAHLGGLAAAFLKSAIGGMLGARVDVEKIPNFLSFPRRRESSVEATTLDTGLRRYDEVLLFSETQSRMVVSVAPENKKRFEEIMKDSIFAAVGEVTEKPVFEMGGISLPLEEIIETYRKPLRDY